MFIPVVLSIVLASFQVHFISSCPHNCNTTHLIMPKKVEVSEQLLSKARAAKSQKVAEQHVKSVEQHRQRCKRNMKKKRANVKSMRSVPSKKAKKVRVKKSTRSVSSKKESLAENSSRQPLGYQTEVPNDDEFDQIWEEAYLHAISKTMWLSSSEANRVMCSNCFRSPVVDDPSSSYFLKYCRCYSHQIKRLRTPLRKVDGPTKGKNAVACVLCEDCYRFVGIDKSISIEESKEVDKRRYSWQNIWACFFFDMLFGSNKYTGVPFSNVYSLEYLWRFVPVSLRQYWIPYLEEQNLTDVISLNHPSSFFVDRTDDISKFDKNIGEFTYEGFLRALDPSRLPGVDECDCGKPSILPDVLCPVRVVCDW